MSNFAALIATIQANIKTNGNEEITGAILQDVLEAMVQALGTEAINNLETALGNEETARQNADGTLQDNIEAETLRAGTAEAGLDNRLDTIEGEIPSAASSSNKLADKAYVDEADTALGNAIGAIEDAIENGYVYAGIATPSGTPASGKVFYLAVTAGTYTNYGALVVTQGINILKNNGTAWSQEQLIALDNTPTPSSSGLVKSGGVLSSKVICFSIVNSDGVEFFNQEGWNMNKSCFLKKNTGEYSHFPDVESTMCITNYILVKGVSSVHFKGKREPNTALCVCYDDNLNIISVINADDYSSQTDIIDVDIAINPNSRFLRFTSNVTNIPTISIDLPLITHSNNLLNYFINQLIGQGDNLICSSYLNSDGKEFYKYENWDDYKSCFLSENTGIYRHYDIANGYVAITKYLPVQGVSSLRFTGYKANQTALCVEYDRYFNIINVINASTGGYDDTTIQLNTSTCFVRFSVDVRKGVMPKIEVVGTKYKSYIEQQVLPSVDKYFDNVDKYGITQYNPINVIRYSAGLSSIFHEWAFCGDSLSSGANFDPYGSQGSNVFWDYTYSWCQRLIHMIGGANGANYSYPGWTTQSWITNVWNDEHDANYVTNGQTEKFKVNKKQAYVLFLGTNDLSQSAAVGNIDTDIDINDYTQNADTFAGRYGGIIQRIKSIQPSAKIFVITIPTYLQDSSESSGLNNVIRGMKSLFTNVFLIDAAKYTPNVKSGYVYMWHFSTAGYQWFAYLVASYIDYIIRSYPTSFKYVTIIGTSHDHGDL